MRWRYAIIYPDDRKRWEWFFSKLFGKTSLERIVTLLHRSGVSHIRLHSDFESHRNEYTSLDPLIGMLSWDREPAKEEPVLLVKGGYVWEKSLITWFDDILKGQDMAVLVYGENRQPLMASCPYNILASLLSQEPEFPGSERFSTVVEIPQVFFPAYHDNESEIIRLARKPSDRPHVAWVRKKLVPIFRFCSNRRVHPNSITLWGFGVHVLGCVLLAVNNYLMGLLASLLLILSWVLDCADGSYARLTMQESKTGQKLDTLLGNTSNVLLFASLIWREYSSRPFWGLVFSCFIFFGIAVAYVVHEKIMPSRKVQSTAPPEPVMNLLIKINHRDYTFVIFLLALVGGLELFLWLGLVGIYVYWLTELYISTRKNLKGLKTAI